MNARRGLTRLLAPARNPSTKVIECSDWRGVAFASMKDMNADAPFSGDAEQASAATMLESPADGFSRPRRTQGFGRNVRYSRAQPRIRQALQWGREPLT
jgi:hypothetical protein